MASEFKCTVVSVRTKCQVDIDTYTGKMGEGLTVKHKVGMRSPVIMDSDCMGCLELYATDKCLSIKAI